mmetsp:Transcript_5590/g.18642  ORF Transcript_5590/g.18642 Transcript_5590/m.18642 type:complete len:292 (+) Transcript_5590:162-1037(+)
MQRTLTKRGRLRPAGRLRCHRQGTTIRRCWARLCGTKTSSSCSSRQSESSPLLAAWSLLQAAAAALCSSAASAWHSPRSSTGRRLRSAKRRRSPAVTSHLRRWRASGAAPARWRRCWRLRLPTCGRMCSPQRWHRAGAPPSRSRCTRACWRSTALRLSAGASPCLSSAQTPCPAAPAGLRWRTECWTVRPALRLTCAVSTSQPRRRPRTRAERRGPRGRGCCRRGRTPRCSSRRRPPARSPRPAGATRLWLWMTWSPCAGSGQPHATRRRRSAVRCVQTRRARCSAFSTRL